MPLLNLSIQAIDRAARSNLLRRFDPAALGRALAPRRRHLAYMSVWAVAFAVMSAFQGVGDDHRGQFVPFWQQACTEQRPYACEYLADMQQTFCVRESGWACNEFGLLIAPRESDTSGVTQSFQRGCAFGFAASCTNLERLTDGGRTFERAPPTLMDYPVILRGTKGPIGDLTPSALYARACEQGFSDACASPSATARAQ